MPQINLLPQGLGKKAIKKSLIKEKVLKISSVAELLPKLYKFIGWALALIIALWAFMFVEIKMKSKELNSLRLKQESLKVPPQEFAKIKEEKDVLDKKIVLLEEFLLRKLLWSKKLKELGDLVPEGAWLTNVSLEKRKIRASGEQTSKKEKEVEQQVIIIKGNTVAPTTSATVNLVGVFIDILKNDREFSQDFSEIKLGNFSKGSLGPTEVINFELVCNLK